MGADKNSSPKRELGLCPKFTTKDSHRVCQGRVVTTDLPTLETNPKQSRSESTTQKAKDLATLHSARRTVRELRADCPRGLGGPSARHRRTVRKRPQTSSTAPTITDRPWRHLRPCTTNTPHADCPRTPGEPSAKSLQQKTAGKLDRKEDAQEQATNTKNTKQPGSTRIVRGLPADCPLGANRAARA
jgi:hypothetical protein